MENFQLNLSYVSFGFTLLVCIHKITHVAEAVFECALSLAMVGPVCDCYLLVSNFDVQIAGKNQRKSQKPPFLERIFMGTTVGSPQLNPVKKTFMRCAPKEGQYKAYDTNNLMFGKMNQSWMCPLFLGLLCRHHIHVIIFDKNNSFRKIVRTSIATTLYKGQQRKYHILLI